MLWQSKKVETEHAILQQFLTALIISFVNLIIGRYEWSNRIHVRPSKIFIYFHKMTSYQLSTPIVNWQQVNCTCAWLDTLSSTFFSKSLQLNLATPSFTCATNFGPHCTRHNVGTLLFLPLSIRSNAKRNFVGGWNRWKVYPWNC